MQKRILIAPNTFKNSLSSVDVASAIQIGLKGFSLNTEIFPIADGGDGTIDVIKYHFKKSKYISCAVHDPLMRKIKSKWLLLNQETAVIELAKASGISLLKRQELNPLKTSTFGTGELILSALNRGCKKIIISLGGSATVDAGIGILSALGVVFFDKKGNVLPPYGDSLHYIDGYDTSLLDKRVKKCKLIVLCDVQNPLTGKYGTVEHYSQQKGANKRKRLFLEAGMKNLVKVIEGSKKTKHFTLPMTGSAGGVAYLLSLVLNAKLYLGFEYLATLLSIKDAIRKSDLIITGEGSLDRQTMYGKGVYELVKIARNLNKPVVVICGKYDKNVNWKRQGIKHVFAIKEGQISLLKSMKEARKLIVKKIENKYRLFSNC